MMFRAAASPCRSATTKCSTRMRSPVRRIRPARDVARREDVRRARLEIFVDRHAAIHGKAGFLRQPRLRPHADADDDEIGIEPLPVRQRDALLVDRGSRWCRGGRSRHDPHARRG